MAWPTRAAWNLRGGEDSSKRYPGRLQTASMFKALDSVVDVSASSSGTTCRSVTVWSRQSNAPGTIGPYLPISIVWRTNTSNYILTCGSFNGICCHEMSHGSKGPSAGCLSVSALSVRICAVRWAGQFI
jgi:hypothetical protein